MSDKYIPIKKLSDSKNREFYPLTAAKAVITTENITSNNIFSGKFGNLIPEKTNLYDILVEVFKTKFGIDTDSLSDSNDRVPSSLLIKSILLAILGGNENLKFKVCTYIEYQQWLRDKTIDENTLYFTYGDPTYFSIVLNSNGGLPPSYNLSILQGSPYGNLPSPTRDGYDFVGWYTDGVKGRLIQPTDIPDSNTTLYAHWQDAEGYDLLRIEENENLVETEAKEDVNIRLRGDAEPDEDIILMENGDPVLSEDGDYHFLVEGDRPVPPPPPVDEDILAAEDYTPFLTEDNMNNFKVEKEETEEDILETEDDNPFLTEDDEYNFEVEKELIQEGLLQSENSIPFLTEDDEFNFIVEKAILDFLASENNETLEDQNSNSILKED